MSVALTIREETVDGRDLYAAMDLTGDYSSWIKYQISRFQLVEGRDFTVFMNNHENPLGGRPTTKHNLTLTVAKRIALSQNSEAARKAHEALIKVEDAWNSPEQSLARALQLAGRIIAKHEENKLVLMRQIATLQPKGEVYDRLNSAEDDRNIRTTLMMLGLPQKATIESMITKKILYRDSKNKLTPYAYYGPTGLGWFRVINPEDQKEPGRFWKQTVVTAQGRLALAQRYAKSDALVRTK